MKNNVHQCILPDDFPADIRLYHDYHAFPQAHLDTELLLVLSGQVRLCVGPEEWVLQKDDLICINAMELHSFNAPGSVAVSVTMPVYGLCDARKLHVPDKFLCNSVRLPENDHGKLRSLLGQLLWTVHHPDAYAAVRLKGQLHELLYTLMAGYGIYLEKSDANTEKNETGYDKPVKHLERALDYMTRHFTEKLTLNDMAARLDLTPQYLTRLFRQYFNRSFFDILSQLRLDHAKILLEAPDITVEQVAEQSGYPNTRAFIEKFKEACGMTPGQYKKAGAVVAPAANGVATATVTASDSAAETVPAPSANGVATTATTASTGTDETTPAPAAPSAAGPAAISAVDDDPSEIFMQAFETLYGYISDGSLTTPTPPSPVLAMDAVRVDAAAVTDHFKHRPLSIISFDKGQELLYGENQEMMRQFQKDMHFKYLRFHGLFNDAIGIYSEDYDGRPRYSFNIMDQIFDFILSLDLTPMVELSFMPRQLVRHMERNYVDGNYFSYPKSMEKWNALVTALLLHLEDRYGRTRVSGWPFWVWNQPDNPHGAFYLEDDHFLELYRNTYFTIKKINPAIPVGTPAFMAETLLDPDKYNIYEAYWQAHDCLPDFVNMNFYSIQFQEQKVPGTNRHIPLLSMDSRQLRHNLEAIHKNRRKYHWHMDKLYLQEWNYHLGTDLLSDTLFKGVYIIKNLLENHGLVQRMGYWTLVDFAEKYAQEDCPFRGDLGIYTYNGIRKCAYYALSFVNRLGPDILFQNDYCIITRSGGDYQVLLYSYVHFKEAYALREYHNMTVQQRYHQFEDELPFTYDILLEHLPGSRYLITESTIGHRHGSAYEQWAEMGGMAVLSREDVDYINKISLPLMRRYTVDIEGHCYKISGKLEPLMMRLMEIKCL